MRNDKRKKKPRPKPQASTTPKADQQTAQADQGRERETDNASDDSKMGAGEIVRRWKGLPLGEQVAVLAFLLTLITAAISLKSCQLQDRSTELTEVELLRENSASMAFLTPSAQSVFSPDLIAPRVPVKNTGKVAATNVRGSLSLMSMRRFMKPDPPEELVFFSEGRSISVVPPGHTMTILGDATNPELPPGAIAGGRGLWAGVFNTPPTEELYVLGVVLYDDLLGSWCATMCIKYLPRDSQPFRMCPWYNHERKPGAECPERPLRDAPTPRRAAS